MQDTHRRGEFCRQWEDDLNSQRVGFTLGTMLCVGALNAFGAIVGTWLELTPTIVCTTLVLGSVLLLPAPVLVLVHMQEVEKGESRTNPWVYFVLGVLVTLFSPMGLLILLAVQAGFAQQRRLARIASIFVDCANRHKPNHHHAVS